MTVRAYDNMQSSINIWNLAGPQTGSLLLESRLGRDTKRVAQLGITSHPFIHEYTGLLSFSSGQFVCFFKFWTGNRFLSISGERVSICQVQRALVHSLVVVVVVVDGVNLYHMPECRPQGVHCSVCASESGTLHWGQTIGKHLGSLADPSGFCSARRATLRGSL